MPIGSWSGLDFFVPQTFFDDQWFFAHTDQQGGVGMPLRYNNDKRKKPANHFDILKKLGIISFPIVFLIHSAHSNQEIDENE